MQSSMTHPGIAKTRELSGRFRNIHHLLEKETTGNTQCHPGLANSQLTEDLCMNVFPRTPTDSQFWVSLLFSSNEYHVGQPNTVKINLFNKLIEINSDDLEMSNGYYCYNSLTTRSL